MISTVASARQGRGETDAIDISSLSDVMAGSRPSKAVLGMNESTGGGNGEQTGSVTNDPNGRERNAALTERVRLVQPAVLHALGDLAQLARQVLRHLVIVEPVVQNIELGRHPLELLRDLRLIA
jgi:hypothetical protein